MNISTPWEQFKFGVFLGMGLIVAYGVLRLILMIIQLVLSGAGHQDLAPRF